MVVELPTKCVIGCEFDSYTRWGVLDTTLCDQVCSGSMASQWFSSPIKLKYIWYNWNIVENGVKHPYIQFWLPCSNLRV